MSQFYNSIDSGILPGDIATEYVTSVGTAVPANNILNILGATGSGNTVNIFAPNQIVNVYDDFLNSGGIENTPGYLQWTNTSIVPETDGTATHPGIAQFDTNAQQQTQGLVLGTDLATTPKGNPIVLGSASYSLNWVFNLIALSSGIFRYNAYVGFVDNYASVIRAMVNGVYFSYSDNVNSGNWVLNCTAGGITTTVNTAIAAAIGFNNFGITVNSAGTLATFYINGALIGTISTNIPTASGSAIAPGITLTNSIGTGFPTFQVDLFYMQYILNTAR